MKKMNLKFFGLGAKIVLPLFLLVGLFLGSVNTVSAQYVPESEALEILKVHVDQIDATPALKASDSMYSPEQAKATTDAFRHAFGVHLIHFISEQQMKVAEAINATVDVAESREFDEEAIEMITDEYIELLTD